MAKYNPTVEVLRISSGPVNEAGNVKTIELEYNLSYTDSASKLSWTGKYNNSLMVEKLEKKFSDFSESELIALIPSAMYDVFEHHFDIFAPNPVPRPEDIKPLV